MHAQNTPHSPRPRPRGRLNNAFYEEARYLDTLNATPEQVSLLADVLALWVRHTFTKDAAAVAPIFRALGLSLRDTRERSAREENDKTDTLFRGAFYDRLRELRGEARGYPATEYEREGSDRLAAAMRGLLDSMRRSVTAAAAVEGEGYPADVEPSPAGSRPKVVELASWRGRAAK